MGIGPIANVSLDAVISSGHTDATPIKMTRVENSASPSDDSYSPCEGCPAGGAEDDGAGDEREGQPEGGEEEAAGEPAGETGPGGQLSIFA